MGQALVETSDLDGAQNPGAENPRLHLRQFFAGPENRLVPIAVQSVLDGAGQYNPLLIHGPSGVGKSHLIGGIYSQWTATNPRYRSVFTTASDFADELSDAIETQAMDDFRARYRRLRLLIFEGVDLLAGKPAVQEELINTFDPLLAAGRQIVLTASVAPMQLPGIMPALQSRLLGGLIVLLSPPTFNTRVAILARLAELRNLEFGKAALRVLAKGLSGSASELDGALAGLAVRARISGGVISKEDVQRYLAVENDSPQPSIGELASATARCFSLKLSELRSPSRRRAVVTARGVAMYLARHLAGKNLDQIGQYFSGRDHSTVMHNCRKTERLLKTDPAIRDAVGRLQKKWKPV